MTSSPAPALIHLAPGLERDPGARRSLSIGILGAGRLGVALAGALAAAGYGHVRLAGRDAARVTRIARALRVEACAPDVLVGTTALAVLAVPDAAIAEVARAHPWRAGQAVVHASGATPLEALAAARERGSLVGCLHPIQTFPVLDPPAREAAGALLRGITAGLEAPSPLDGLLRGLAEDLGMTVVRLEGVDRALYHAAAVLVSNDVVALMAAATRAWGRAGLPPEAARTALAPLLRAAAANAGALPAERALTGPVARGDAETVERHLRALSADDGLTEVYRALARELLHLDLGHPAEVRAALRRVLGEGG